MPNQLRNTVKILNAEEHVLEAMELSKGFIDFKSFFPCKPVTLKILLVVDGAISFSPDVNLGLSDVIDTLRDPEYIYVRYEVTMATREGNAQENITPELYSPRYRGFRFDRTETDGLPTIDKYDQLWLYGIHSGNTLSPSHNELKILTNWMNSGGGLFATGDHDTLGEAMCKNIPRISTMRKWTITDKQAPLGQTNLDEGNPDVMPFKNHSDNVPQPLELKLYGLPWSSWQLPFKKQPHPLMCDPQRGFIDVFPGHPHEDSVRNDNEVDLNATYNFGDGVSGDHYPTPLSGLRPTPTVVAWANTLGSPNKHAEGDISPKCFGVVGVYNGQAADVGRVVVDSTWYHWFNIYFPTLKSDTATDHWERNQTYFRNVGIWMATKEQRARMLYSVVWNYILTVKEFNSNIPIWVLGATAKDAIGKTTSASVVHQTICDIFPLICDPVLEIERIKKIDKLCLMCPPFELLENAVLGGAINNLLPLRDKVLEQKTRGEKTVIDETKIAQLFNDGLAMGAKEIFDAIITSLGQAPKIKNILEGLNKV
ncbi:MAG: hypothetical protein KAH20_14770 [Methylococcales bacterium]|nr:hypothetical protein [Methylococcales bacterium]